MSSTASLQLSTLSESNDMQPIPTDYLQLICYLLFLSIGLPVNIATLIYMLRRYRHSKSLLLLLHIHLNISDILVLSIYCPGVIGWLITYEWCGGALLCIIMRYLDAFVFALSSNMLVCIALYRLYALRYPVIVSTIGMQRVPQMVAIGWILAAVFVSPQLYVWRQVTINGITQCVTIWTQRYHQSNNQTTQDDEVGMKVYNGLHLMIIFWMPLAILVVCYVLILHDVYRTLNGSTSVECSESDQQRINKTKANTTVQMRGQDRLRRAKVRSLRITLYLIMTYAITWLPYNLIACWNMINIESYRSLEDYAYFLHCFVVLNSVINPVVYGRCAGLRLLVCSDGQTRRKSYLGRLVYIPATATDKKTKKKQQQQQWLQLR